MSLPIPQPPAIPLLGNIFDVNPDDSIASLSHLAGIYGVHRQQNPGPASFLIIFRTNLQIVLLWPGAVFHLQS
jgi:hypothetical protein